MEEKGQSFLTEEFQIGSLPKNKARGNFTGRQPGKCHLTSWERSTLPGISQAGILCLPTACDILSRHSEAQSHHKNIRQTPMRGILQDTWPLDGQDHKNKAGQPSHCCGSETWDGDNSAKW